METEEEKYSIILRGFFKQTNKQKPTLVTITKLQE